MRERPYPDGVAWDEAWKQRQRADFLEERVNNLTKALQGKCEHRNTRVIREGMTGICGTVICNDCGYERDWNAY